LIDYGRALGHTPDMILHGNERSFLLVLRNIGSPRRRVLLKRTRALVSPQ
jgi:hypothetical protein